MFIRQVKCISEDGNGELFVQGLQEELIHQLFKALERLEVIHFPDAGRAHPGETPEAAARRHLEVCSRIDTGRIRTSVRLLDTQTGHVKWSEQFDRDNSFDIAQQEELAYTICNALKLFMVNAGLY